MDGIIGNLNLEVKQRCGKGMQSKGIYYNRCGKFQSATSNQQPATRNTVSIIIPYFNKGDTIASCLNSIRRSKYKDYEIIVVDDASKDGSLNALEKMEDVRFIKLNRNVGPAKARNIGATVAKAGILLFIDADVIIKENTIQEIVKIFSEMDNVSTITGLPELYSPHDNLCSQHFNMRVHFKYMNLPDYVNVTYTTITAIKSEPFFVICGFNEDLKTAGVEDAELGFDLIENGYQIYLPKHIQVIHNKRLSLSMLLKNEVARARDRIKLVLRRRLLKKESIAPGIKEKRFVSSPIGHILSSLISPVLYINLFMALSSMQFLLFAGITLFLFFVLNRPYLSFVMKTKGILYACRLFGLILLETTCAHAGFWIGAFQFVRGKRF